MQCLHTTRCLFCPKAITNRVNHINYGSTKDLLYAVVEAIYNRRLVLQPLKVINTQSPSLTYYQDIFDGISFKGKIYGLLLLFGSIYFMKKYFFKMYGVVMATTQ